jgi:hypothetical protein
MHVPRNGTTCRPTIIEGVVGGEGWLLLMKWNAMDEREVAPPNFL